jgi:hypothetical protein
MAVSSNMQHVWFQSENFLEQINDLWKLKDVVNKLVVVSATEITPYSFVHQEGVDLEKMVSVV